MARDCNHYPRVRFSASVSTLAAYGGLDTLWFMPLFYFYDVNKLAGLNILSAIMSLVVKN